MIQDILALAQAQVAKGGQVALVTVTETHGSSPASAGQLMAVLPGGETAGTVGGGATEFQLIARAVDAMKNGERVFRFSFDHAENGMVCGGGMSGFGNVLGSGNRLYIFGGGHVGQALAKVAALTGFFTTVVEDRPELEPDFSDLQGVEYVVSDPGDYHGHLMLPAAAYAVICTRGHRTDGDALRFCLNHSLRYIGMIGSAGKVSALFAALRGEGYSQERLDSVYTPIGLDIARAVPAEIAVAILAEILLIKNGGSPGHKRRKG